MALRSQSLRQVGWEIDALRLGTKWSEDDLDKPQILIDSTYGYSHPGSIHLNSLATEVMNNCDAFGGKGALFYVTDICDGIAQGHAGMNYSLLSRELMSGMVEVHAQAHPFDGVVLCSSCDKSVPAHLIAAARLDLPVIHLPGGTMTEGPNGLTLEQIGTYGVMMERGQITKEEFKGYERNACPGCGACQFMGTACTMQVMSEALGLALPGTAVTPTALPMLKQNARRAGEAILHLVKQGLTAKDILTPAAFRNALVIHAAIGGSTNAFLHLPAIAREVGLEITPEEINTINAEVPYLADVRPSGHFASEYFWYAGGVPRLMSRLKEYLDLSVMTVTGKTLGENLVEIEKSDFFQVANGYLHKYGINPEQVIRPLDNPISSQGSVAVLTGNLAPKGSVVKYSAIAPQMHKHVGPARTFDSQKEALDAIVKGLIHPGEVIVVRYEGPKGSGMPEMFYLTEALAATEELVETTAIVTDGRFSGATRGPNIGHVSPEAAEGGVIAVIEDGDLISIDIQAKSLQVVGINGMRKDLAEVETILAERLKHWVSPRKKRNGILGTFTKLAASPMEGASLRVTDSYTSICYNRFKGKQL